MVHLAKDSDQKLRVCILPEVKPIPKMKTWVFINRNHYYEDESDDESNDGEADDKNKGNSLDCLTDVEFVNLIDTLVPYQVEENITGNIMGQSYALQRLNTIYIAITKNYNWLKIAQYACCFRHYSEHFFFKVNYLLLRSLCIFGKITTLLMELWAMKNRFPYQKYSKQLAGLSQTKEYRKRFVTSKTSSLH